MENSRLYDLMDWGRIEGLVYSEESHPHELLGASETDDGILIQAFNPEADSINVLSGQNRIPMEKVDENGFFAVLVPGKKVPDYTYEIQMRDQSRLFVHDPYNYESLIPEKFLKKFRSGVCYDSYTWLGAHPETVDGVRGIYFAVWAPNAVRVSVVGDFNSWDGRTLPMRKLDEYGIFELFVPGLETGVLYKYEIKAKHGLTFLKSDPYGFSSEKAPGTASMTADLSLYSWGDKDWMERRSAEDRKSLPVSSYQIQLSDWMTPGGDGKECYTYREIADRLADYVKEMGYTHVELLPVMEYSDEKSSGYATTMYYAPTSRFGRPEDFMYLVDHLHRSGIGVVLTWVPSHFPRDINGLIGFDGTCLYEHLDRRKSLYAPDGGVMYNYSQPGVKDFLISNALFWVKKYHVDGLRLDDISHVLYLDFGKAPGQWVPNLYGTNENLEAVEFFKHLNSVFHKESGGAVMIAEDTSQWPMVTVPADDDGLGFDFKWNTGFKNTLTDYIQLDPIFRGPHHQELIFSMVYNYSENFTLALSCGDVTGNAGSMYSKVPGRKKNKLSNLRVMYGYMVTHPGKKLFAMGCEIAQKGALEYNHGVEWDALDNEENKAFQNYCGHLLKFYRENPALYALDYDPEGFEWINNISANENMLVFLRKSAIEEQTLLVVVNFSNVTYENHKIGVPFSGKYKEIFNSDRVEFGGDGHINPRVKRSKPDECDELPDSIRVIVPPLGISVFSCTRVHDAPEEVKKPRGERTVKTKKSSSPKKSAKASSDGKAASSGKSSPKRKPSLREELTLKTQTEDFK